MYRHPVATTVEHSLWRRAPGLPPVSAGAIAAAGAASAYYGARKVTRRFDTLSKGMYTAFRSTVYLV